MLQSDHSTPPAAAAPSSPDASSPDKLLHEVIISTPSRDRRADGIAVGILVGFDHDGAPLVDIPLLAIAGARARTVAPLDASRTGQSVALGFESSDPARPIILGLMLAAEPLAAAGPQAQAILDGEKVLLTASHEIELRCGEAAIVLASDGRVQIRGTYITSHATATHRILGGSVNVN